MKQNLVRVRLFCKLVGRPSPQNKELGMREAWRVAGIATGKIVAMPDDVIAWWWKIQEVVEYDLKRKSASAGK